MTPQERQEFNTLRTLVQSLLNVKNVTFVENLERRVVSISSGNLTDATSITESVRNSSDTGSETVAKNFDGKLEIIFKDGTRKYIGVYNS